MGLKWRCDFHKCEAEVDDDIAKKNGWDNIYITTKYNNKALDKCIKRYILCPKHLLYVKNIIEGGLLAFDK